MNDIRLGLRLCLRRETSASAGLAAFDDFSVTLTACGDAASGFGDLASGQGHPSPERWSRNQPEKKIPDPNYQSSGTNFWLRITVIQTSWLPWCSVLV